MSKKDSSISFGIEFSKIISIVQDEAFTTKDMQKAD